MAERDFTSLKSKKKKGGLQKDSNFLLYVVHISYLRRMVDLECHKRKKNCNSLSNSDEVTS